MHPSAVKQYCPAAEARSPRRWGRVGSPRRCPEEACWCGRPPARTWTLCCLRATSRWGTAGRMMRSRRASRGWRVRRGRQQPRCKPPRGRAGQGWESAEREGGRKMFGHTVLCFIWTQKPSASVIFFCVQSSSIICQLIVWSAAVGWNASQLTMGWRLISLLVYRGQQFNLCCSSYFGQNRSLKGLISHSLICLHHFLCC